MPLKTRAQGPASNDKPPENIPQSEALFDAVPLAGGRKRRHNKLPSSPQDGFLRLRFSKWDQLTGNAKIEDLAQRLLNRIVSAEPFITLKSKGAQAVKETVQNSTKEDLNLKGIDIAVQEQAGPSTQQSKKQVEGIAQTEEQQPHDLVSSPPQVTAEQGKSTDPEPQVASGGNSGSTEKPVTAVNLAERPSPVAPSFSLVSSDFTVLTPEYSPITQSESERPVTHDPQASQQQSGTHEETVEVSRLSKTDVHPNQSESIADSGPKQHHEVGQVEKDPQFGGVEESTDLAFVSQLEKAVLVQTNSSVGSVLRATETPDVLTPTSLPTEEANRPTLGDTQPVNATDTNQPESLVIQHRTHRPTPEATESPSNTGETHHPTPVPQETGVSVLPQSTEPQPNPEARLLTHENTSPDPASTPKRQTRRSTREQTQQSDAASCFITLRIRPGFDPAKMTPDTFAATNSLKDIIQNLYDIQSQTYGFRPETQNVLINKIEELTQSLGKLQDLADPTINPDSGLQDLYLAPEIIDYVDDGRNPDIYGRDFIEAVQRGNAVVNGKKQAFKDFSVIFAQKLKEGIGGIDKQVDMVMENAGMTDDLKKAESEKARDQPKKENGEKGPAQESSIAR